MSKPLPSPFPDMADAGQLAPAVRSGAGVPGFVFLSQPQGDSMRPTKRHYNPPNSRGFTRGHPPFLPHHAKFGDGNSYRGSNGNNSPYRNSRGRGYASNSNAGNLSPHGIMNHGNSNRGNSHFEGRNTPNETIASFGNNSSNSPFGNRCMSGYNSPRGHNSAFGYSSPCTNNFSPGPNSSPAPSLGGHSSYGSPSTASSSLQSSPFSGPGGPGHRGRGGRGQNSHFLGNNRRGGRGGRNAPISEVPPEKFMSNGILQNPWDKLITFLDPKKKDVFLAEEEDVFLAEEEDVIGVDGPRDIATDDHFNKQPNVSDITNRTLDSTVPSNNIEEGNVMFADSWQ